MKESGGALGRCCTASPAPALQYERRWIRPAPNVPIIQENMGRFLAGEFDLMKNVVPRA
jgi:hypothetical protein